MGCKYTKSIKVDELVAEADNNAKFIEWHDPLDIADLYIRAGNIYRSQYRYKEAIEVFDKASNFLEGEAEITENYIRIAELYTDFDQIEAINYYRYALETTINDNYSSQCWYKIGMLYEKQLNLIAAIDAYQRANEWLITARLYRQLQKYKEATTVYLLVLAGTMFQQQMSELILTVGLCALCTDDRIFIQEVLDYLKTLGLITNNLMKLVVAIDNHDIIRLNKIINKIQIEYNSCSDLIDYIRDCYHNRNQRFLL